MYYFCSHHKTKTVTETKKVKYGKNMDKTTKVTTTFQTPTADGPKSLENHSNNSSGGTGLQRAFNRHINSAKENDNASLLMQTYETIDVLEKEKAELQRQLDEYKRKETDMKNGNLNADEALTSSNVVISYKRMDSDDDEVKRRTGFQSLKHMLAYIILVCNGDHDKMTQKTSTLTWLEEWFFAFEYLWGRTCIRWWDSEKIYKVNRSTTQRIFLTKLGFIKTCRLSWPRYASYSEDFALMKNKWREKYKDVRLVMWDDTNVNFAFKPGDADAQRLTYSMYYSGNCAKAGVFLQLCGWMGGEHLWVSATSDSHYQEHTRIFEKQEEFARDDLVEGLYIAFTNMLDKGYRVNLPAWRAGRQQIYQPIFAKSDRKFTGRETIRSADIATDRSGNERAVNR